MFTILARDENTVDKIIDEASWFVMGFCFSVQRWPSNMAIEEVLTHLVAYWVQVDGIPLNFMSAENTTKIGGKLGSVVEIEDPWSTGPRGFLRIRIQIDVRAPLVVGFWLPRAEGPATWVELKYEKLSDFCYGCGKLGHT